MTEHESCLDPLKTDISALSVIQSRRSVRSGFLDIPIPNSIIDEITKCGLAAPSSKNAQPWRIHVVRRGETLLHIADDVQFSKEADTYVPLDPSTGKLREWPSTVAESAQVLREVGVGLFIENKGAFSGGRRAVIESGTDVRRSGITGYTFEVIGLGAMIQNMWLGAHTLGLSGCFMGDIVIAEREIQSRLNFTGDLIGVLALGYPLTRKTFIKSLQTDSVVYH